MKHITRYFWFRFLASAAIASVVVVGAVGAGIRYYERPPEDPLLATLQEVKVVNLAQNPLMAEAIRKEREKHEGVQPERTPPPPPPAVPERQVVGFVHVEYTINEDGSVSDVRVVGAAPSGVYEEQAMAQIRRSMHAPAYNEAGDPVARRASEIVEFTVPASALAGTDARPN